MLNPLDHPVCLSMPRRLTPYSAWHEHIPFAMFLVDVLRPKVIVELGTAYGDSYCAFCQAVDELGLDARCYAIDTWQGDPHTGFYGPEVLADLRAHHDPLYGHFSRLIQSTFDEALGHFQDGSIDLLHIDGYHTYEQVRHDFESWLPKMSPRGIILLHDINVLERDFGVRRFWDEVKARYPHFEFLHCHGLGVLAVGEVRSRELRAMFEAGEEGAARIRDLFFQLGRRLSLSDQLDRARAELADRDSRLHALEAERSRLADELDRARAELAIIKDSFGYSLMRFYTRVLHGLMPDGTRRGELRKIMVVSLRIIRKEGWRSWCRQALEKIKRREFYIIEPGHLLRQQESKAEREEHTEPSDPNWSDYWILSQKISEYKRKRLEKFRSKPREMISLDERLLPVYVKSLNFRTANEPQVSIIIPVYNNEKLTIECLASILTNTEGVSYEIIIIDDGSSQRTQEILSKVNGIIYLKNPSNLGFLLSCNRAAEKARGEFLLFLNNDVQVTRGWLRALVDTFSQYEGVGAVGPKILYPDGRLQEAGARIKMDASSQLIGAFDDPELPRYNYVREVEYCSGACLLLQKMVFQELGGFDTKFAPGYYEDADLCFRLRARGLRILYNPNSVIIHHLSATMKDPAYKQRLNIRNQQKFAERWQETIDDLNRIRLIAFYLPQYHPIPENDLWWGKGFTEWTNVTRARPNFRGHYQPHLPADLGFYDLRVQEVMEQQAELAKRYGIYGFCYFYYWFAGKRLLEMPLERMLKTGKPNIPFCLCWANENWTRRWDGRDDLILIGQQHSDDDDRAVIRDIMRYMKHPNYIRINGKPLLLVYRVSLFPDIKRTTEIWRELCRKEGIGEIYLAMVESFEHAVKSFHPSEYGFDASVEYPPHQMSAPINPPGELLNPNYRGVINDYREIVLKYLQKEMPGHVRFRTVMPGWDNTPRRQNDSVIFAYSSPGAYQAWLEAILELTLEQNFGDERIVFINAWNEWAEGNYLEPDQRFGHGFLEATKNALERTLLRRDGE